MNIIVNGKKHEVNQDIMSYDDLADLAGAEAIMHPSMTFRSKASQGILDPGESLAIVEGMVINVYLTNNA